MKKVLFLLSIVAMLVAISTSAFAVTSPETENVLLSEQQAENKPNIKFRKVFGNSERTNENKPTLLEGSGKPDMSKIEEKDLADLKKLDKEAVRKKLDEMLTEGTITREKYDAIISGEIKPSFDGKNPTVFKNRKIDAENDTNDRSTEKPKGTFIKKARCKFVANKKDFNFLEVKG